MIIEITVRDSDARIWKYFLGKRYKSKAGIKRLCKLAILTEVAKEAKKDVPDINYLAVGLKINSNKRRIK